MDKNLSFKAPTLLPKNIILIKNYPKNFLDSPSQSFYCNSLDEVRESELSYGPSNEYDHKTYCALRTFENNTMIPYKEFQHLCLIILA